MKTRIATLVLPVAALLPSLAFALGYDSGGTGADGALAPTGNVTIAVPATGILDYTTIAIPAGVTVRFLPNATNTSVTLRVTGDVLIEGSIDVSGQPGTAAPAGSGLVALGGLGGPGGSAGGSAAAGGHGLAGHGPAGGDGAESEHCTAGGGGGPYEGGGRGGPCGCAGNGGGAFLVVDALQIAGGSGGGASAKDGGGGGGGAITLASSGTIVVNGEILANGGAATGAAGAGSGGYIRLVADVVTGEGLLSAGSGACGACDGGGCGGAGVVLLESVAPSGTLLENALPWPVVHQPRPALVTDVDTVPTLRVVSVAAVPTPTWQPAKHPLLQTPIAVTGDTTVTVAVEAHYVALGTKATVSLTTATGRRILASTSKLAGNLALSTATATLAVPRDGGIGAVDAWIPTTAVGGEVPCGGPDKLQTIKGGCTLAAMQLCGLFTGKSFATDPNVKPQCQAMGGTWSAAGCSQPFLPANALAMCVGGCGSESENAQLYFGGNLALSEANCVKAGSAWIVLK